MRIVLCSVTERRTSKNATPATALTAVYVERLSQYAEAVERNFATEAKLLEFANSFIVKARTQIILLDSTGKQFSSEQFAAHIGTQRDNGTRQLMLAIGPADGWSPAALAFNRNSGGILLSLGPMTLPHSLALTVLAEQTYRAFTILANHPYHCGH
jgi:23S rRNA (pseudouridine1915-N3)-methyltransferase